MRKSTAKITSAFLAIAIMGATMTQPVFASMQDKEPTLTSTTTSSSSSSSSSSSAYFSGSQKCSYSSMQSAIKEYAQTNADVKGWLIIPGTNINEPILFNNQNNSHYAYRDWKGTDHPYITYKNFITTAAYTDFRTKYADGWGKSSQNTVIYGHNWTNLRPPFAIGSQNNHIMFGQLPSYTDLQWASEHPYIYYSTGQNEGVWKVFAVAYCELKDTFKYNTPNPSSEEFVKLVQEWKARSIFDFDVDVTSSDRILTLSTCTRMYDQGANQRYCVIARLLRDGESDTANTVKVTVNSDYKAPQF